MSTKTKIPLAMYPDDIAELISRLNDDHPDLSENLRKNITRHECAMTTEPTCRHCGQIKSEHMNVNLRCALGGRECFELERYFGVPSGSFDDLEAAKSNWDVADLVMPPCKKCGEDHAAISCPLLELKQTGEEFPQPDWATVQQAFVDGAREARANPEATEEIFGRTADAYCKLKYHDFAGVFSAGENRETNAIDALITLNLHVSDSDMDMDALSLLIAATKEAR